MFQTTSQMVFRDWFSYQVWLNDQVIRNVDWILTKRLVYLKWSNKHDWAQSSKHRSKVQCHKIGLNDAHLEKFTDNTWIWMIQWIGFLEGIKLFGWSGGFHQPGQAMQNFPTHIFGLWAWLDGNMRMCQLWTYQHVQEDNWTILGNMIWNKWHHQAAGWWRPRFLSHGEVSRKKRYDLTPMFTVDWVWREPRLEDSVDSVAAWDTVSL